MRKDIVISDEYDETAFLALKDVLTSEGAQKIEHVWGVAGSQEINAQTYKIGDDVLEVSSETYIGLTISGDSQLVSKITEAVRERLAQNNKQR